ncbi:hypothetical protein QQ045_015445 [Rhodiola kirilowii]
MVAWKAIFGSSRGLHQGDPISPYLFTLVMEVLSRILDRLKVSKGFNLHPKSSRINLMHLIFADDVIIFSKANIEALAKIKVVISLFYDWSGLKVSNEKSAIYFGGCSDTERSSFAREVGFQQGRLPFVYLGVRLDGTNIKGIAYNPIIEKMTSKFKSRAAKCLSYAGRLVLVKHVLSSICSYWIRVLIFPKAVLKKIIAICRNFLWSEASEGKRNLVAWRVVCQPKECGGLGIKNLWQNNKA